MDKYYNNFIMCGEVDFYCLVCEEPFKAIEDVEKHLRWGKHRRLLKLQICCPKFKKDPIFKIGNNYYCQCCNSVTPNVAQTKKHISNENHVLNKEKPCQKKANSAIKIKRIAGLLIEINKTLVDSKYWHGVVDKHCVLCDTPVVVYDDHNYSTNHMVKLIQSEIKEQNGKYYRKVNAETLFCFNCKKTFAPDTLSTHWIDPNYCGPHPLEKPKKYFDVDKENFTATCTICHETIDITLNALYDHKYKHTKGQSTDNDEPFEEAFLMLYDRGNIRARMKEFGKNNFIKLLPKGAKGFCSLCTAYLSASLRLFKEHVNGLRHKLHLQRKGLLKTTIKLERPKYKTKPFQHYQKDTLMVNKESSLMIHPKFCVERASYFLMLPLQHNGKVKCYICDEEHDANIKEDHALEKLNKINVIENLKNEVVSELVREIVPNLYHCGYCNWVYPSWQLLQHHLSSMKHKVKIMQLIEMIEDAVPYQ